MWLSTIPGAIVTLESPEGGRAGSGEDTTLARLGSGAIGRGRPGWDTVDGTFGRFGGPNGVVPAAGGGEGGGLF
jgi:hypothetical protein